MLGVLLALSLASPQATVLEGAPPLERVAVVRAAAGGAEIIRLQPSTRRAVLTLTATNQIELFDLADPARPRSLRVFDLGLEKGEELTSVALPPSGDWFLATVKAKGARSPGRALAHSLADGARLASFVCGVGPDSVVIAPGGALALIANEAEGFERVDEELLSAPGSLTLVHLADELARSKVVQIPFERALDAPEEKRLIQRQVEHHSREIPLENGPTFLEPEGLVFLPDETHALVTLQENDAVAWVDLATGRIERTLYLGSTTHPADLLEDGRFDERTVLTARREPDGIALTPDGRYFLTADEGATEPVEGGDLLLGTGPVLGGGRTLSVFDATTGALVGDTGPQLDRIAALAELYPDKRSPKKGSEPEMVLAFLRGTIPFAVVTLERAGALALVDLRDPTQPAVVAIARTGDAFYKDEPEGLAHFRDPTSEADYFYVANEGTGTLGVLRILR